MRCGVPQHLRVTSSPYMYGNVPISTTPLRDPFLLVSGSCPLDWYAFPLWGECRVLIAQLHTFLRSWPAWMGPLQKAFQVVFRHEVFSHRTTGLFSFQHPVSSWLPLWDLYAVLRFSGSFGVGPQSPRLWFLKTLFSPALANGPWVTSVRAWHTSLCSLLSPLDRRSFSEYPTRLGGALSSPGVSHDFCTPHRLLGGGGGFGACFVRLGSRLRLLSFCPVTSLPSPPSCLPLWL